MKKLSFIIATLIVCLVAVAQTPSYGQTSKEGKKTRKYSEQLRDDARGEVNRKPSKAARAEATTLRKQGFHSIDGTPIEYMLDEVYICTALRKADGKKQYTKGTEMATYQMFSTAQSVALDHAKVEVAKNLNRLILNHAKNELGTDGIEGEVFRTLEKTDLVTSQELAFCEVPFGVYKCENGKYTVKTTVVYNLDDIMEAVNKKMKKVIEEEIKDRLDDFTPIYEKVNVICDGVQCHITD